jgi:hypothetical protein
MALGIEILVVGALSSYQITKMIWHARALLVEQLVGQMATRIGFAEAATIPTLVAGGMLAGGVSQGLYVQAAGLFSACSTPGCCWWKSCAESDQPAAGSVRWSAATLRRGSPR